MHLSGIEEVIVRLNDPQNTDFILFRSFSAICFFTYQPLLIPTTKMLKDRPCESGIWHSDSINHTIIGTYLAQCGQFDIYTIEGSDVMKGLLSRFLKSNSNHIQSFCQLMAVAETFPWAL